MHAPHPPEGDRDGASARRLPAVRARLPARSFSPSRPGESLLRGRPPRRASGPARQARNRPRRTSGGSRPFPCAPRAQRGREPGRRAPRRPACLDDDRVPAHDRRTQLDRRGLIDCSSLPSARWMGLPCARRYCESRPAEDALHVVSTYGLEATVWLAVPGLILGAAVGLLLPQWEPHPRRPLRRLFDLRLARGPVGALAVASCVAATAGPVRRGVCGALSRRVVRERWRRARLRGGRPGVDGVGGRQPVEESHRRFRDAARSLRVPAFRGDDPKRPRNGGDHGSRLCTTKVMEPWPQISKLNNRLHAQLSHSERGARDYRSARQPKRGLRPSGKRSPSACGACEP
jgi:hypothetical protein